MKKINHLVVDSGAFIKSSPIHEYAENIYTVKGVIQEIKDKATLQRLQFLPYTLNTQEPTPEAFKYVSDFSKKTGDYSNLSLVDMQVLALTYQLEKENIGTDHLNKEPSCKVTEKPAFEDNKICGFYFPKKKKSDSDLKHEEQDNSESTNPESEDGIIESEKESVENVNHETASSEEDTETDHSCDEYQDANDKDASSEAERFEDASSNIDAFSNSESDEDSDEDAWITPHNVADVQKQMGGLTLQPSSTVACITTDFCIQNVLIQMGLNVVAVNGMQIKHTRIFALRCHACFKTTSDMTKKFCPSCGNQTLKRVAVTVNEDGSKNIHINFRKPLNIRGKRYSLPMPKGGKHGINPILFEDQPIAQNRPSKRALQKIDSLSQDYVAQSSPFAINDVYTRAAHLGIRSQKDQFLKWRNPNETSKRTGNRKKTKK